MLKRETRSAETSFTERRHGVNEENIQHARKKEEDLFKFIPAGYLDSYQLLNEKC